MVHWASEQRVSWLRLQVPHEWNAVSLYNGWKAPQTCRCMSHSLLDLIVSYSVASTANISSVCVCVCLCLCGVSRHVNHSIIVAQWVNLLSPSRAAPLLGLLQSVCSDVPHFSQLWTHPCLSYLQEPPQQRLRALLLQCIKHRCRGAHVRRCRIQSYLEESGGKK